MVGRPRPLRISHCFSGKDILVQVIIVGSPEPSPLSLLSHKGHFGPSNDGRESEAPSASHVVKDIVGPSNDGRDSEAPSVSHVVVLYI
jgi:hypothetical protein